VGLLDLLSSLEFNFGFAFRLGSYLSWGHFCNLGVTFIIVDLLLNWELLWDFRVNLVIGDSILELLSLRATDEIVELQLDVWINFVIVESSLELWLLSSLGFTVEIGVKFDILESLLEFWS
jgi:hypothetical protein